MIIQILNSLDPILLDSISNNTKMTAENTQFSTIDWISFGIAVFALFFSLLSVVYAHVTYFSQKRTEENTKSTQANTSRITHLSQQGLLEDMVRHLYRNMVVTYAIKTKLDTLGWDKHYPSEEHLIKLKMPVENIHLEAFYDDGKFYSIINRLYLLLRNYNTEIDIALLHFPQSGLNTAVKKRDLDTLLFKPGFLTENIMEVLKEFNYKELPAHNTIAHEIQHTSEQNQARKQGEQWTHAYTPLDMEKTAFVTSVFERLTDGSYIPNSFTSMFNKDVIIECGKNENGSEKVFMIPFHS